MQQTKHIKTNNKQQNKNKIISWTFWEELHHCYHVNQFPSCVRTCIKKQQAYPDVTPHPIQKEWVWYPQNIQQKITQKAHNH